jgi:hypothetical protein
MPDVLRIRYFGDTAFLPLAGREVDGDSVFDLAAKLLPCDEAADHVLIEAGNPPQPWALAKALYAVETPAKRTREAEAEPDDNEDIEE